MKEQLVNDIKILLKDLNLPEDTGVNEIIIALGSMTQAVKRFRDNAIASAKRVDLLEKELYIANKKLEEIFLLINGLEESK